MYTQGIRLGRNKSSKVSYLSSKFDSPRLEIESISVHESKRGVKELTLKPHINSKTTLTSKPEFTETELRARQEFLYRIQKGKEKTDWFKNAMDLRHVGKFIFKSR